MSPGAPWRTSCGALGPLDLVFCDVDKEAYPDLVETVVGLLSQGGLFVTDNALWKGRVLDPETADETTRAVQRFNRLIACHPELKSVILPLRDGLLVSIRVPSTT